MPGTDGVAGVVERVRGDLELLGGFEIAGDTVTVLVLAAVLLPVDNPMAAGRPICS